MITSKNTPLFLRSISFSCQPKLIQSITPNHECRARLLRMWHLTRRQALLIGVLDPWRFCFSKPMTIVIYIHGAVLDLLLMVLEVCHGHIHMWSKGNQCLWTGILVPHRHRLHLGKMVRVEISLFSVFPRGVRGRCGCAGGQCWALLLATAGRLSLSRSKAVLPASGQA